MLFLFFRDGPHQAVCELRIANDLIIFTLFRITCLGILTTFQHILILTICPLCGPHDAVPQNQNFAAWKKFLYCCGVFSCGVFILVKQAQEVSPLAVFTDHVHLCIITEEPSYSNFDDKHIVTKNSKTGSLFNNKFRFRYTNCH